MEQATTWLKETLHYEFTDERLLRMALTHRSATGDSNERFEFLGDAVLQLVISEWVFEERPNASEGRLSRLRSSMVKDATLAKIAIELGVGDHVILGSGEKKSGGHRRSSILADTMEAIFAAVYLDAGFDAARKLIRDIYARRLAALPEGGDLRDPKTRLQEYLQGRQLPVPEYRTENVSGKAHKQSFEVSCTIEGLKQTTTGNGLSRRNAEQDAATAMLALIDNQD